MSEPTPRESALMQHHAALVSRRKIPAPYTTIDEILALMEKRIMDHPRGIAGVAEELGCARKSLWGWLRGFKIPSNDNLQKFADLLSTPLLGATSGIQVRKGVPMPERGYRFASKSGKSRWGFIGDLDKGSYFEIAYPDAQPLRVYATKHQIKIATRTLSRDRIGVWIK